MPIALIHKKTVMTEFQLATPLVGVDFAHARCGAGSPALIARSGRMPVPRGHAGEPDERTTKRFKLRREDVRRVAEWRR